MNGREYAEAVVAGTRRECRWVRLACERHLRDLETGKERGLVFDERAARTVLAFMNTAAACVSSRPDAFFSNTGRAGLRRPFCFRGEAKAGVKTPPSSSKFLLLGLTCAQRHSRMSVLLQKQGLSLAQLLSGCF